jgi:hypothetical protein
MDASGASCSPSWLVVDGASVTPALVSRPATLLPGDELHAHLVAYAGIWSVAAAMCARRAVVALRRALRTTRCPGDSEVLSTSQSVTMRVTELEIEAELCVTAARALFADDATDGRSPRDVTVALAAARALAAITAEVAAMSDRFGVALDGPLAEYESAATLDAYLGGVLTLENEVARDLGLSDGPRTPDVR